MFESVKILESGKLMKSRFRSRFSCVLNIQIHWVKWYNLHNRYGGVYMENHKLIDKLKNETNISYEEAKIALEKSNWDILDAFVYLEEKGEIQKPSVSIFYTNEYKENKEYSEITINENQENNYNSKKKGQYL
eukprot:TRINITY_DN4376_c0_g2_i1.p5 TRINITY_DN4376_c0_g2~~TRINITY_DN4376_c0_g2_i1.p5  ORF type:complete len:133 (+),score=26.95 TRINITY_DN4376_c0_g2_i1:449-847(+)